MVTNHMRVVISGANGFLGSWVCRILADSHEVTAIVRTNSDLNRLEGINGLKIVSSLPDDWAIQIRRLGPDAYISMDWEGVRNNSRNESFQHDNLKRIKDLLNRLNQVPIIIGTGSQAELGSVPEPINESQPDSPTTEYGRAKVAVRSLFNSYAQKHGIRWVWARVFSTYGPLDSGDWLIPATMKALSIGRETPLTKGEQQWSYLHAYDLALAYKKLLEVDSISGIVNIGNPVTIQIRDVVTKIAQFTGNSNLLRFGEIPYRTDQVMKLAPKCESLTSNGWWPKVDIDQGLSHLYSWLILQKNSELILTDGEKIKLDLPVISLPH